MQGKELRLKQQHFMVSATLQDIVKRFKEHEANLEKLPDKVRSASVRPSGLLLGPKGLMKPKCKDMQEQGPFGSFLG